MGPISGFGSGIVELFHQMNKDFSPSCLSENLFGCSTSIYDKKCRLLRHGSYQIMTGMSRHPSSMKCDENYSHVSSLPSDINDFEIWLGYTSPGDDFFNHLAENGQDVRKALKTWSADLAKASATLEHLAEKLNGIQVEQIHVQDRPGFAHIAASDEASRQTLIEAAISGVLNYSDYEECPAGAGFHVL